MYSTDILRQIKHILFQGGIEQGEASALALMLIEETTGLSRTQILTGSADIPDTSLLLSRAQAIAGGTPIQHILGYAYFMGMKLKVNPSVLIPRPETEELINWVLETTPAPSSILDIGTGSGCIAIALKRALPQAHVTALDISPEALTIAQENARNNNADIDFLQYDILNSQLSTLNSQLSTLNSQLSTIISNPPYICRSEADEMDKNVLDHEPHLALFVPDDDPLLFYRAIATQALHLLIPGGKLFFEINRRFASELQLLLHSLGYSDIILRTDQFGNKRMIKAQIVNSK
ncbi:MAG: peptide chain release factor N(5)-glutamine methyltransferase [Bacteroidaceae bacterium]|nr:peptide chain release factor N(5)-glutamine methyltransferase [Bacteroidaceae bacterium]